MIFNAVSNLKDKSERKFFTEKITIYVKIVKLFAEKNALELDLFNTIESVDTEKKLIDIGIIEYAEDFKLLKYLLGEELYSEFIRAVNFNILHEDKIDDLLGKLNNSYRKKLQIAAGSAVKPTLIDFFCGAGGLSLGFVQEGYRVKLANDFDEVCCETYKYNHPEIPAENVIQGDIRDIVNNIEKFITDEVDVVVGGPPCQGFSSANQQRIIDDPRNELYKFFIKAIEKIAPKFVVMENVRGMISVASQVVDDFRKISVNKNGQNYTYEISYRLLNSQNFSVAQNRMRLIFIAIRNDIATKTKINPETLYWELEEICRSNSVYVLQEALDFIKPLDSPRVKNRNEIDDDKTGKKIETNPYIGKENPYLKLINENREIPLVFNHKARFASDTNYKIFNTLKQGEDATAQKIENIMPYPHRNHVFKDKYFRLVANKPCRTITAHLRMDCLSHIHPHQARTITPREAARVQSFPDDYFFLGPYLKTYMQIGNAVPPLMSRGIAKLLKKYLK